MANLCVAKISSRVKGHHVYQYNYTVGEDFSCAMEPSNIYSKNTIAVKEKNSNTGAAAMGGRGVGGGGRVAMARPLFCKAK